MLLAIGLIAGAAGISANARDVQLDYIDSDYTTDCETTNDLTVNYLFANATAIDEAQEQCDFILRLRNSQATAAVSYCNCDWTGYICTNCTRPRISLSGYGLHVIYLSKHYLLSD